MQWEYAIDIDVVKENRPELRSAIARWLMKGWKLAVKYPDIKNSESLILRGPYDVDLWRKLQECQSKGIFTGEPYCALKPHFTRADFDSAEVCSLLVLVTGFEPSRPGNSYYSMHHYAKWDDSEMCQTCKCGMRQISPARFTASSLAKKKFFGESGLADEQIFLRDDLRREIETNCDCELPILPVEAAGKKEIEPWCQLMPTEVLELPSVTSVGPSLVTCDCGRVSSDRSLPWTGESPWYFEYSGPRPSRLPPVMLSPIWDSPRYRSVYPQSPDGLVLMWPMREILLRGDVARYLVGREIPNIELQPWPNASMIR